MADDSDILSLATDIGSLERDVRDLTSRVRELEASLADAIEKLEDVLGLDKVHRLTGLHEWNWKYRRGVSDV